MVTTLTSTSLSKKDLKVKERELARIVGRHYKLFKVLHPDKKFNLQELAAKTEKDPGNLSKLITSLENKGIVETQEVKRERGRPFKYIFLSSRVMPIISAFIKAVKPTPEHRYDPITIDVCLNMIEDYGLPDEIRELYADLLHSRFMSMPEKTLKEDDRLRGTLEEVVKNPSPNEGVEERKRSMIKLAIPRLILDESTREWVLNHVHLNALKILEDETKPENIVTWAISMLEAIGMRSPEVSEEIKRKLMEKYFNETITPNSIIGKELLNSILRMFCQQATSVREITEYVRQRARSSKDLEREKATLLLKKIIGYLPR